MIVGEVVEILIRLRDGHQLTMNEDNAVCYACNILDQLPSMVEADDILQELKQTMKG